MLTIVRALAVETVQCADGGDGGPGISIAACVRLHSLVLRGVDFID